MFAQQIIVVDRRDVIVADLIGILRRGGEIGRERNLVAAKFRRVDDVQLFLGRKGNESFLLHELARRFHGFLIGRQNIIARWVLILDLARDRFDALAGRQLISQRFQFLFCLSEERFAQRE